MKSFYTRNINKIAFIAILLIVVSALAGCRQGTWSETPYTTWGAEFHFDNFMQGVTGWPVAILSYPIAFLMGNIGKLCGNSYAWGIILTTIIVRTIAWPIYAKQNSSSVKMQQMQPELQKIQRKYQGRKDPASQQRMQQETMALYKKYKMNPLGCGLTLIIQFPIFMAMYECVRRIQLPQIINGAVEIPGRYYLANTKIFGIFDINTAVMGGANGTGFNTAQMQDKIFGIVIAVLFAVVTLISQKLGQRPPKYQKKRPSAVKSQQQEQQAQTMKFMSYFMVVMFFIMSLSSTALALYWLVGGIYQLGQSEIGRKLNEREYYKAKNKSNII